jgi:D-alanyl-D-alanine carboxypeptidase
MGDLKRSLWSVAILRGLVSSSFGALAVLGSGACGLEPVSESQLEQGLVACSSTGSNAYSCTLPGYRATPAEWWQDSGIDVTVGDRISISCSGMNLPWGGHSGFTCAGAATTYWTEALTNLCTFGSLVGRIGSSGAINCIGNNGPWAPSEAGRLYLAFNDGVSFTDNSGQWLAAVTVTKKVCERLQALVGQPPSAIASVAMSAGACTATMSGGGTVDVTSLAQALALYPSGFGATFAEQNLASCALVKEAAQLCKTGSYQQASEPQVTRTKLCHPGAELGCTRFVPNFPQIFQTAQLSWTPGSQSVPPSFCSGQVTGTTGYSMSVPSNPYQWTCTAAESAVLNQNASQVAGALGWPNWPMMFNNCDGAGAGTASCNLCRIGRALRQCVLPNLGAATTCTVPGTVMTGVQYANVPGYCFDIVQLTGGAAGSPHAEGRAMDLNNYSATAAPHNNGNIFASGSQKVMNVLLTAQLDVPPAFVSLMEGCGFVWGGRWWDAESVRLACDPMHFELP